MVSSYGDIDERLLFRLCYDGTLVYTLLQYNGFVPTSSDNGVWNIHCEQCEVVSVVCVCLYVCVCVCVCVCVYVCACMHVCV